MESTSMNDASSLFQDFLKNATGPIPHTLKNDLMFHYTMQLSPNALKGLVCALKGISPATVDKVILMNTIDYGSIRTYAESPADGKVVILDVKVLLNDSSILEIELQMYRDPDWIKRSILYLCRSFDSIGGTNSYDLLMPTTLVAIIDETSGFISPGFYSKYLLRDEVTHTPYSSILGINVLDLSKIDKATEADKEAGLVYWAEMFRASTWEDIKALAAGKNDLEEAVMTMYNTTADQHILSLMEGHERWLNDWTTANNRYKRTKEALDKERANARETKEKLAKAEATAEQAQASATQAQAKAEQAQASATQAQAEAKQAQAEAKQTKSKYDDLISRLKEKGIDPDSL